MFGTQIGDSMTVITPPKADPIRYRIDLGSMDFGSCDYPISDHLTLRRVIIVIESSV